MLIDPLGGAHLQAHAAVGGLVAQPVKRALAQCIGVPLAVDHRMEHDVAFDRKGVAGPAFKLGEKLSDPVEMYANDLCTVSANIAGIPGISIPCGSGSDNMPIGLQLMAKPFAEDLLLNIANKFEMEGGVK